ncbi:unnamed protein product [Rhizophagus irregularis]|nr:unnamed protein product [Rhizophagus irregularis]
MAKYKRLNKNLKRNENKKTRTVECNCQICSLDPNGYKKVSKATRTRHRAKDRERSEIIDQQQNQDENFDQEINQDENFDQEINQDENFDQEINQDESLDQEINQQPINENFDQQDYEDFCSTDYTTESGSNLTESEFNNIIGRILI